MSALHQSAIIGYISMPFAIYAYWLSGNKNKITWILNFIILLMFTYVNSILKLWGFVGMDVVSLGLTIRGYQKWRTSEDVTFKNTESAPMEH